MPAHQLESEEREENGMVKIFVTIDEELLRMLDTFAHNDVTVEDIANVQSKEEP